MSDLISRQAAIDALEKVAELYPWRVPGDRDSYSPYNEAWNDALNRAESEIEALPSAQPERKKGKWIEYDSDDDKYDIIKCKCCKHLFTVDSFHWTDIGFTKGDFKFCPNCGADMQGDSE